MEKKLTQFKAQDSELRARPLCLGGISWQFGKKDRTDSGLYGNIYYSSVDYSAITNDKILDMQKYLMEKNKIK